MKSENIFKKVREEVRLMILEAYDGVGLKLNLTDKIMIFVDKAIRKTIIEKDSEVANKRIKEVKEQID